MLLYLLLLPNTEINSIQNEYLVHNLQMSTVNDILTVFSVRFCLGDIRLIGLRFDYFQITVQCNDTFQPGLHPYTTFKY